MSPLTRSKFTHMETSPLPMRDCKFSSQLDTWHWEVFSLPYLLWQGVSVHNGRLRGPLTLTIVAEHLAVELSLPILVCGDRDSNTKPSACKGNALTDCAIPPSTATRSLTRRDVAKIKWSGELSFSNLKMSCFLYILGFLFDQDHFLHFICSVL